MLLFPSLRTLLIQSLLTIACLGFGLGDVAAADRQPIPDEAALKSAQAAVNDLFKAEFAAAKNAKAATQKRTLADKLLAAVEGKPEAAANDYVLLTEALNLTSSSSSLGASREIVDRLATLFVVDQLDLTLQTLKKLEKGPTEKDYHRELATVALQLAAEAQRAERLDIAAQYLDLTDAIGRRLKSVEWSKLTKARRDEMAEYKKLSESYLAGQKTLLSNPQDHVANEAVGSFLIAVKRDWNTGLIHLSKASTAALKKAAEADSKAIDSDAPVASADQATALADFWWDAAPVSSSTSLKAALLLRAGQWYSVALPQLSGLAKTRAEKRVAESGWENDAELRSRMPLNRREHQINVAIESGRGMLETEFAIVQMLPISAAKQLDELLKTRKFRAIRFRPFSTPQGIQVAAIWRKSSVKSDLFDGTTDEVLKHNQELQATGFIPSDVAGYVTPEGQVRHVLLSRIGKFGEGESTPITVNWQIVKDRPFDQPSPSAMWTRQEYFDKDGVRYNDIIWRHPKKTYYYFSGTRGFFEKQLASQPESMKQMDVCVSAHNSSAYFGVAMQGLNGFTVTEIHGLTLEQNLVAWRKVMGQGGLPVAIGVAVTSDGAIHSASVWHTSEKK